MFTLKHWLWSHIPTMETHSKTVHCKSFWMKYFSIVAYISNQLKILKNDVKNWWTNLIRMGKFGVFVWLAFPFESVHFVNFFVSCRLFIRLMGLCVCLCVSKNSHTKLSCLHFEPIELIMLPCVMFKTEATLVFTNFIKAVPNTAHHLSALK